MTEVTSKEPTCRLCGRTRTEGSHTDNPRWQGSAGKYKTLHTFEWVVDIGGKDRPFIIRRGK